MNKTAHSISADSEAGPAYGVDAYGWAMAQADFLRQRRLDAIDWQHVAEEIASIGRSEWRSVESAFRIVLLHRLKWQHQPSHRGRSWRLSITEHLEQFEEELADNPSLGARLDDLRARAYRKARLAAARETGLDMDAFPAEPPSWDEIRAPLPD
jgi:hypothetical protein